MALSVQGISKNFGKHQVLSDIHIEVPAGHIYGLVGLNGIGKTTLIKIILDLIKPTQGTSHIFGDSSLRPESRYHLTYMPEKFLPSPNLKGEEFLALALSFYDVSYDAKKAEQLAKELDLVPSVLPNMLRKYSKGMGQKIGLMSNFLADRPLMIFDEPMSGLDPRAKIFLKQRMKQAREEGKTIFFSSHILSDIEELCDHVAVLHDTKLLFAGVPEDFREQHQGKTLEESFLNILKADDNVCI